MNFYDQIHNFDPNTVPSLAFNFNEKQPGHKIFDYSGGLVGELYRECAETRPYSGDWTAQAIAYRPIRRHTKPSGENITSINLQLTIADTAQSLRNYYGHRGRLLVIIPYIPNRDVSILLPPMPHNQTNSGREKEKLIIGWMYQEILAGRITEANTYHDLRIQQHDGNGLFDPKYIYDKPTGKPIGRTLAPGS